MENRDVCYNSKDGTIIIGTVRNNDETGRVRVDCVWIDEFGSLKKGGTKMDEKHWYDNNKYVLVSVEEFIQEYSYFFKETEKPVFLALNELARSRGVYPHFYSQSDVDLLFSMLKNK